MRRGFPYLFMLFLGLGCSKVEEKVTQNAFENYSATTGNNSILPVESVLGKEGGALAINEIVQPTIEPILTAPSYFGGFGGGGGGFSPTRGERSFTFFVQDNFRNIDGSNNHPLNYGKAAHEEHYGEATIASALVQNLPYSYLSDGDTPNVSGLPHPRVVSNAIFAQNQSIPNEHGLTHFVFFWGQFIDHDITLVLASSDELFPIPAGIDELTSEPIPFIRSNSIPGTGTSSENPRVQANSITSFIDGSNVYGSTDKRSLWLRTLEDGLLKVSADEMLPLGDDENPFMANDNPFLSDEFLYVGGDVRANEVFPLLSLHTIFVREHNRIAKYIKVKHPHLNDEEIYQLARKVVGALIQSITYNEFLPALGVDLPQYDGYKPDVDPRIRNIFATAGFRFGHTMIPEMLQQQFKDGSTASLPLFTTFFSPNTFSSEILDSVIRASDKHLAEKIDDKIVNSLRNFLFGHLDLAMLNIHRGRDHGLPKYLEVRTLFDGQSKLSLSKENELLSVYSSLDDIDLWVGMLCEPHIVGKPITQTIYDILKLQFTALRDGDKFFYLNDKDFSPNGQLDKLGFALQYIESRTASKIIVDNTNISSTEIGVNMFQK